MEELRTALAPLRWQWPNYSRLRNQPVPPLRRTMGHFLKFAKLLVSDQEYKETVELVNEFSKPSGEGELLQDLLEMRARNTENWMAEWWLNSYLTFRGSIAVNTSPAISFPRQKFTDSEEQLGYAAVLIEVVLQFKDAVDSKSLKLEIAGNLEMDMSTYDLLFGTTRIPGEKRDTLRYSSTFERPSDHIIVIRNGHLFCVPVFDTSFKPLSRNQIFEQLKRVKEKSETVAQYPVGILTTENRTVWAKIYKILKSKRTDASMLDLIERSLFILCLDRKDSHCRSEMNDIVNQLLHGNGSKSNGANRWFDKTIQYIVNEDGINGLVFEHSPLEAMPILAMMDAFVNRSDEKKVADCSKDIKAPFELSFTLTDELKQAIVAAGKNFDSLISSIELNGFCFETFGKNVPKAHNLSPDSFIQLALQLAYYRCHGKWVATYETGSLRRFKLGRTETIRLPNKESVAFVKAMEDTTKSNSEKAQALRKAVLAHRSYTSAACSGNGMDRHLLSFKWAALEEGRDVPNLFKGKAYQVLNHYKLLTSQVPARFDGVAVYGPSFPDSYECCYNPLEEKILFLLAVSCPYKDTNAQMMKNALEKSLLDMRNVLFAAENKAKL